MASSDSLRKAQVQKRSNNPTHCLNHQGSNVLFVCLNEDCDKQLACVLCVTDTHRGHLMEDVAKYADAKRQNLKEKLQQHENGINLSQTARKIKVIDEMVAGNRHNFQERQSDIKLKCRQLQEEMNIISEKLIQLCRNSTESNERKLNQHKICLEKLLSTYREKIIDAEIICRNGSDQEVIVTERTFILPKALRYPKLPEMEDLKTYDISEVSEITDSLHCIMRLSTTSRELPKGQVSFQVPVENENNVKYVCAVMDQVLIWFWNSRNVLLYNKNGIRTHIITLSTTDDNTKPLQENDDFADASDVYSDEDDEFQDVRHVEDDIEIRDVFFSPFDTSLWYCCSDKTVWQKKNDGMCSVRFRLEENPIALCVCNSGNVVVGTTSDSIMVYSPAGEELDRKTFHGFPRKIIYCWKTRYFAILEMHGSVIILDKDLNHVTVLGKHNSDAICFDSEGNLFMASTHKQIISMQDIEGNYLKKISQISDDIYPITLSSVNDGSLWVSYREKSQERITIKLITY